MKKIYTILVLFLFATSLLAQAKLKKETSFSTLYKEINLYDKNNGKLFCSEIWDSTRLLANSKSMTYRKNTRQYDAQNRIVSDEYTRVMSDAKGKKLSSSWTRYKTQYGNPTIYTTLNWDADNNFKDSTREVYLFTNDNMILERKATVYSGTASPYLAAKSKF
jgi:hypothetical protein